MTVLLEALGVTKRFGGLTAVHQVDLRLEEGVIASLIGPNGAGKTTLFNCMSGFYSPEEGDITFAGRHSLVGMAPDRIAGIGISRTYQNIRLFGSMTALENILVGRHTRMTARWPEALLRTRRHRGEERAALERARELLQFVSLAGLGDELARSLPYGAQRRLELARALASEPRLLLLDEPTAGMNPRETDDMMSFIRRLRDVMGVTVLLIEHDMRVVMGISERITVLDYGAKIAEGAPREIQSNPRVVEAYLGRGSAAAESSAGDGPGADRGFGGGDPAGDRGMQGDARS